MKLKRMVSVMAALAVSATTFAGMMVTANADWQIDSVYNNAAGTSVVNTSGSLDISEANITSGKTMVNYVITTTVDYSNLGGDRPGIVTLQAANEEGENIDVFSIYANTYKNAAARRYSIGTVASASSTLLDNSRNNDDSHEFIISLTIDFDNDTVSGSISNDSIGTIVIGETKVDGINSFKSFALTSSSSANEMAVKNIEISKMTYVEGYVLKTTPYATVLAKDNVFYADKNGNVDFGTISIKTDDKITISKEGYESVTFTVENSSDIKALDLIDNNMTYYEGFDGVTDNFGFDQSADVSNGVLHLSPVAEAGGEMTFAKSIDLAGKTLTLRLYDTNASTNHYGYLDLLGTNTKLYFYGKSVRLMGSNYTGFVSCENYVDISIVFSAESTAATLYANGVNIGYVSGASDVLTGLLATHGKGTVNIYIDSINISSNTSEYSATFNDDGNMSYSEKRLSGYALSVTLPTPVGKDGYIFKGWSDGEKLYNSGEIVEINSATTFTAIYEQEATIPSAVSATHVLDYTDETAEDAATGASLWQTLIEGTDTAYNAFDIAGTIKNAEGVVKTNSNQYDMGTTISTGDVYIYIAVNQAKAKLADGQTMELTVTPVSK